MATLKFDMTDPQTKATVGTWTPNTEYSVQTTDDPTSGVVEDVEGENETGEPADQEPVTAGAPGPAAVKAAMAAG